MYKKYFVYLVASMSINLACVVTLTQAEVCLDDSVAVDIATILDASERDLDLFGNCEQLVSDLYDQLNQRDKQVESVTKDLIHAKQDVIKYKAQAKKWKTITWYTAGTAVIVVILKLLPAL